MEGEKTPKRFRIGVAGLVAFVATLAALAMSSVAAAGGTADGLGPIPPNRPAAANDPLGTNIPYLAWRGEEVRLVKCYDVGETVVGAGGIASRFFVDFTVVDWSGDPHMAGPEVEPASIAVFAGTGERAGDICFSADVISMKPGAAQIEMAVSYLLGTAAGSATLDKHVFNVIWMTLNAPTIFELSVGGDIGATPTNPGSFTPTGAPPAAGTGNFAAGPAGTPQAAQVGLRPGQVAVQVTGTFPLMQNYTGLLGAGIANAVLPRDWAALADALADDNLIDEAAGENEDAARWDIHDDPFPTEGHVSPPAPAVCLPPASATGIEAVDNCPGDFSFSNLAFGASTPPTAGPFDPTQPRETLLTDGKLDQYDAPMPSARVDFRTGGAAQFGAFNEVLKQSVYSRNGTGAPTPHNLYAPYYTTWLPATERPVAEASGIAGPRNGNNFEGFLNGGRLAGGRYVYWRFADTLGTATSNCLLVNRQGLGTGPGAIFTQFPGDRAVSVYTDEHGEAIVAFNPAGGFNIAPTVTNIFGQPVLNENGGCDIEGVVFSTQVQAFAKYPYKPVIGTPPGGTGSNTLTKTLNQLFRKAIDCRPKVGVPTMFVCTATARDFRGLGDPFVDDPATPTVNEGEIVCFNAGPGAVDARLDDRFRGLVDPNVVQDITGGTVGPFQRCTRLILNPVTGEAFAVYEVQIQRGAGPVDVAVYFEFEEIKRLTSVSLAPGAGTTGTATGGTSPTGGTTGNGGTTGSQTGGGTGTGTVTIPTGGSAGNVTTGTTGAVVVSRDPNASVAPVKLSIRSAKLVTTKAGRFVIVRVNGSAPQAKVKITLRGKNGKMIKRYIKTIPTNKLVQVKGLKVSKLVRSVRVELA